MSDIAIASKIQAFCCKFFPYNSLVKDFTSTNLHKLRNLRNDIFHRAGERNDMPQNAVNVEKPTLVPAPPPTASMFRDTLIRFVKEVEVQLQL